MKVSFAQNVRSLADSAPESMCIPGGGTFDILIVLIGGEICC